MAKSDRISVEDLLALNDEIAALIQSGLPLELGLRQLSDSRLGSLSRLSQRLSERVTAGTSLVQALRDEGDHLPPVYLAIVEAGLRAGRLPEALEAVSQLGRSLLELHRKAVIALIYPVCVMMLAFGLLVAVVVYFTPILQQTYAQVRIPFGFALTAMSRLNDTVWLWGPAVPVLAIVLLLAMRRASSSRNQSETGSLISPALQGFAWLPWMRGIVRNFDRATFARLMSLLVKHETPLHESLVLAGYASGNDELANAAVRLAQRVQSGQSIGSLARHSDGLPAFLRTMIAMGERHGSLPATLMQVSDVYRRQAERQVEFARLLLPVALTCVLGGSAALIYAVAVFSPVAEMYSALATTHQ